ncbi:LOW QUALITY PROTEIN: COP9 signalosome complex subunit 7a-like [Achroia grisella]|uniref:COP9 signalosome complex subunit 7a-like n=1 Tax=Achroia grisella TaxID=688607 RepID=UPI0027D2B75D|nr:COP9 signalosome complex subunit 7a-like [Achroia grisella]XP_059056439.1 LOW QUALITY PROTEIN: COP9 signalosome complex subunit 7a-like [Achroia grisella]
MNPMAIDKDEPSSLLSFSTNHPLEQFVLLAKGAKGFACAELIKQVLEAPGVHVFGELLEMPNIKELENGSYAAHFKTLNLFAYGTYKDYLENKSEYLELTPVQCKKLQHLTIATLATQEKCIPYSVLLKELDIKNVRDLEDLIIEAIYADIIHGKLDQECKRVEVDVALGRDARLEDAAAIADVLADWCNACEAVLNSVDRHIQRANIHKQRAIRHQQAIEQEIVYIKKTLKTQAESEDSATGGGTETHSVPKKNSGKGKTPRNTAKFWQKNT